MSKLWTRRRVLAGASAAVGGLAGCLGGSDDGSDNETMADSGGADGGMTSADDGEENGSSGDGPSADDSGGEGGSGGEEGANASDSDEAGGENGDLDLQEANVTAVSIEEVGNREFEFSVTLYHDDEGEDGYADWWAVETKDVEELGRRELTHGHGTEEFTRSGTVEIPEGVSCVIVRGHDQTHGYGGQAMLVSIPSGATAANQQGSDPSPLADVECP